jgi:sterol desaturase/sphingolipid hydroxylase (fatty acid hydroxylase superfamily)
MNLFTTGFTGLAIRTNILWAVHVNHHSSEKLNFSTAARVPFFNFILHNLFWIPLLFAGFDPVMIFAVENIGFLFAFFQHTQVIRKIPL